MKAPVVSLWMCYYFLKKSLKSDWIHSTFWYWLIWVKLGQNIEILILKCLCQALTNCMHGYDCARNVHTNDVRRAQKFVHGIDWEHNWELLTALPHRPLCFKKIRRTTTKPFLISNTVVPNLYSNSTAFDP